MSSLEHSNLDSQEQKYSKAAVQDILQKFREGSWQAVLTNESIGGNAGPNRAAINSFVEKDTGRIIVFGNIQDVPEDIKNNPDYVEATFVYNFGNLFQRIRKPELALEPASFERVLADSASAKAIANLNRALLEFNNEYIAEQRMGHGKL